MSRGFSESGSVVIGVQSDEDIRALNALERGYSHWESRRVEVSNITRYEHVMAWLRIMFTSNAIRNKRDGSNKAHVMKNTLAWASSVVQRQLNWLNKNGGEMEDHGLCSRTSNFEFSSIPTVCPKELRGSQSSGRA